MKINRIPFLLLALLIPFSYTPKTKTIRTEEAIVYGLFGTVFVGIPLAFGSYWLYKKIRLANRTDDEVYNEAKEYLDKMQATYADHTVMLDEITPDLTYQQTMNIHRHIVDKANITPSFFNAYPLVSFVDVLSSAITECNNHVTWLDERSTKFNAQLEADYTTKFNVLSNTMKECKTKLVALNSLIYNSSTYQHQKIQQLEALARANNAIYIR